MDLKDSDREGIKKADFSYTKWVTACLFIVRKIAGSRSKGENHVNSSLSVSVEDIAHVKFYKQISLVHDIACLSEMSILFGLDMQNPQSAKHKPTVCVTKKWGRN